MMSERLRPMSATPFQSAGAAILIATACSAAASVRARGSPDFATHDRRFAMVCVGTRGGEPRTFHQVIVGPVNCIQFEREKMLHDCLRAAVLH